MDTLLTIGLIGSFTAALTAMHLRLTARAPEPVPVVVRPMDDIDAEFFRIIDAECLRDAWPAPPC
ncbi:MAG: hypothetical protein ACRD0C_08900 [Acidimicrobiia bacterium]